MNAPDATFLLAIGIHTNILKLFSHFYDARRIYIMLEYAPGGDLASEISKYQRFSDARAATYVYQLSEALNYCHSCDVLHRDIKPGNILLGANGEAKITDFGCAVHKPASRLTAILGTINYMAPEILDLDSPHDEKVDVWSVGIVAHEMLIGKVPFDGATSQVIFNQLLQKLPNQRASFADVSANIWMREYSENCLTCCRAALNDWNAPRHPNAQTVSSFTSEPSNSSGQSGLHDNDSQNKQLDCDSSE